MSGLVTLSGVEGPRVSHVRQQFLQNNTHISLSKLSVMKKYYVYILHCHDGSYYTGITNNPERRLAEHEEGIDVAAYTYSRRPVRMVWVDAFQSPLAAIGIEKQIKGGSRRKKEALINQQYDKLPELATCVNASHYSLMESSKLPEEGG